MLKACFGDLFDLLAGPAVSAAVAAEIKTLAWTARRVLGLCAASPVVPWWRPRLMFFSCQARYLALAPDGTRKKPFTITATIWPTSIRGIGEGLDLSGFNFNRYASVSAADSAAA